MRKKRSGSDRSGDRFLHDIMSTAIGGAGNMRKDQAIDQGVREHGSQHRKFFPHRSLSEMTAYMTWKDFVDGRKPDPLVNLRLSAGHMIVDSLPSKMKERMKIIQSLTGIFS